MITDLLKVVVDFIIQTINTLGYAGVGVLMAIESAAIPLPSEVIMPFSGFLVAAGRFSLLFLALAGAIGSVVGSLLTYGLGFYGGRKLILKYGRYVLINEHDLNLTERFFQRFGNLSTFLGRVLPVVRTFISIPAGIGKVPLLPFVAYTFLGSFIWSYFLAWLGFRLGENWHILETYFRKFDLVIGLALVFFIVWWIYRHFRRRANG
jgi:membrane protein DedA with SNARE-associated domain